MSLAETLIEQIDMSLYVVGPLEKAGASLRTAALKYAKELIQGCSIESLMHEEIVEAACVLMLMDQCDEHDLAGLRRLIDRQPSVSVIVATDSASVDCAVAAVKSGVFAFQVRPISVEGWRRCLIEAARESKRRFQIHQRSSVYQRKLNQLTQRERNVLDYVVRGEKNYTIARRLDISVRTVELRRHKICNKLEVQSVAELVAFAVRAELFLEFSRRDETFQPLWR